MYHFTNYGHSHSKFFVHMNKEHMTSQKLISANAKISKLYIDKFCFLWSYYFKF